MLSVSREPLFTTRLELRRTRLEDAAAMFDALRDPCIYAFIPRTPPADASELAARFARTTIESAPDRAAQWLNWTVWLREGNTPLGMVEATIDPTRSASIGYLFDPRQWGRGYAREAVAAMLDHLAQCGARQFEASIEERNEGSLKLVAALGFQFVSQEGGDRIWRRSAV